jgi:hypothetical protein
MGERPLVCFHEMPEAAEETSSKAGNCAAAAACALKPISEKAAVAPAIKELCRKFRREIPKPFPIFDFTQFSGSVFLRARSFGCSFALQSHLAISLGLASRASESGC